jgi:hypothetical protein
MPTDSALAFDAAPLTARLIASDRRPFKSEDRSPNPTSYAPGGSAGLIDRGISSTVLAALMGHESSTITERRYVRLFDRQRADEAVRAAMASDGRSRSQLLSQTVRT